MPAIITELLRQIKYRLFLNGTVLEIYLPTYSTSERGGFPMFQGNCETRQCSSPTTSSNWRLRASLIRIRHVHASERGVDEATESSSSLPLVCRTWRFSRCHQLWLPQICFLHIVWNTGFGPSSIPHFRDCRSHDPVQISSSEHGYKSNVAPLSGYHLGYSHHTWIDKLECSTNCSMSYTTIKRWDKICFRRF